MNADLLTELARAVPPLPGALCRGNPELFDPHDRDECEPVEDWHWRRAAAIRTCRVCPELGPCSRWLDGAAGDPELRPAGVVAARVVRR